MYTRHALLAIVLIQTLSASVVGARGSAITGRASLRADTTYPCTLDVVLVTFQNATTRARGLDYHLHDRPHGSNDNGTYPDPDTSYTLRDFERLFSGGYDHLEELPFVGDTVTVGNREANRDTLPEVFGSVRAYYDSVSNGMFQLHVRMINAADDNGFPRWVELPQTKAHYAEIGEDSTGTLPNDQNRFIRNRMRKYGIQPPKEGFGPEDWERLSRLGGPLGSGKVYSDPIIRYILLHV